MSASNETLLLYLKRLTPILEQLLALNQDAVKALELELEARQKEQTTQPRSNNSVTDNTDDSKQKELDAMGWKDFKNGDGSWTVTESAPKWIVNIMETTGRKYYLGKFAYKLSGERKQFINRYSKEVHSK